MTPQAYVSLGSNLGDRCANLLLGVRGMLAAGFRLTRLSSIYETEPVEKTDQPLFLNMVAELDAATLPSPEQMLARMLRIEYALGRRREVPMGPRTIDLDLLLYKDERRTTDFLMLPHPRLHLRRFVLAPLNELSPHLIHPVLDRSIADLHASCADNSSVQLWRA